MSYFRNKILYILLLLRLGDYILLYMSTELCLSVIKSAFHFLIHRLNYSVVDLIFTVTRNKLFIQGVSSLI